MAKDSKRFTLSKTRQNVAIGLLVLIVALLGVAALRPSAPAVTPEMVAEGRASVEDLNAKRQMKADKEEADKAAAFEAARLVVERPSDRPLNVVFAGDSLTYGLFASTEAKGYRPQVVAALEADGPVDWSRGGQTGNTVGTVAKSIEFPQATDLAVLALGTNDLGKTPVKRFTADYEALVAKVKNQAPDAAILCLGPWADGDGSTTYGPLIEEACEAGGGSYAPLTDLYTKPKHHGPAGVESFGGKSDVFHPNDSGYKAIADRVLAHIKVK